MSENRNADGTFAPAEPLVGQAGVEADLGYKSMATPAEPPIRESTIEEEAANLKAARLTEVPNEVVEVAYRKPDGEIVDKAETVTIARATDDNIAYHTALHDEAPASCFSGLQIGDRRPSRIRVAG
jgi:hypothetical protein